MKKYASVFYALLAALLFGINAPFAKILLERINPLFLAALLYLGAGIGMLLVDTIIKYKVKIRNEARLTKNELPYVVLMILLDIAAPIFLMVGISRSNSSTAALLGNFEIVATTLIAMMFFKEAAGKKLWLAIAFISIASMLLSVGDFSHLRISVGAIFVLISCVCWGLENNCTRNLSIKDPLQVVIIKGFGSGFGALLIAAVWGKIIYDPLYMVFALLLGFVAFGMSIFFYVTAQRELGAARTSAYYAAAPFMGVLISWLILQETITLSFIIALIIMLIGTYFMVSENHLHRHLHLQEIHEHKHNHEDYHHTHLHDTEIKSEHSHEHIHMETQHEHSHLPDLHHRHTH